MKPLHKALIGILLLAAAMAGISLNHILHPPQPAPAPVPQPPPAATELLGQFRPDFSLPDLNNRTRSIREWDGQVLLINFWATWCAPCREEIPAFIKVRERLHEQGFEIIGVAIDRPDFVNEFAMEFKIPYPLLYGQQEATRIGERYGNRLGTLPYSVLIDASGHIRHIHNRGALEEAELSALVSPLLARDPPNEAK